MTKNAECETSTIKQVFYQYAFSLDRPIMSDSKIVVKELIRNSSKVLYQQLKECIKYSNMKPKLYTCFLESVGMIRFAI